jgi:hypothetical protein
VDCGHPTQGDLALASGGCEYYMVHDIVWASAFMGPYDGMLCIGCLERRLGRPLTRLAAIKDERDWPGRWSERDFPEKFSGSWS